VRFDEARGRAPAQEELRVTVKSLERPTFAYSYQIADARKGNGDGKVQKGEHLTMFLTVKNVGKGKSYETQANLRNLSGDGLLLQDGRFDISNMKPGEMRKVAFTFNVEAGLSDSEAKIELSITDRDLRETVGEKVKMPIAVPTPLTQATGTMRAKASGATLHESPEAGSRTFGRLGAGTAANVMARSGDMVKLSLGDGRFGFAKAQELEAGGSPASPVPFEEVMRRFPPLIEVQPLALATRENTIVVKGTASDQDKLLDTYIFVGNRKVFYQSNRSGKDPRQMSFQATLPLRPGVNVITVVARETPDILGRKTLIVRKDGPKGELLQTPRTDEDAPAGFDDD
jgi:carboxyl-terminal processing protease